MSARAWLAACDRVGEGAILDARPTVGNLGTMEIGRRFRLASQPVESHLVTGPEGRLLVGDDVSIAHGAAIAAYERVEIGTGTRIGPFLVLMDTNFHAAGDKNATHDTQPVLIGRNVTLGTRVTVLRGAAIGDGAFVEAGSVVSGDVPAGARVSGVPARQRGAAASDAGEGPAVPELVMRTLGLAVEPPADHGPPQIPQWDSLGALKLLLALEEAFSVSLAEDEVARASSVAALVAIVDRAVARRGSPAAHGRA